MKWCVIIPTYNNAGSIVQVVEAVRHYTANIIVVNDVYGQYSIVVGTDGGDGGRMRAQSWERVRLESRFPESACLWV